MAYYPNKDNKVSGYQNESVAFDVGRETKDSYSITIHYRHNIETDIIIAEASVLKNWAHNEEPTDKSKLIEGKKYKKQLFTGTVKECFEYIDNIVQSEGYWDKHPTESFKQVFIEPTK